MTTRSKTNRNHPQKDFYLINKLPNGPNTLCWINAPIQFLLSYFIEKVNCSLGPDCSLGPENQPVNQAFQKYLSEYLSIQNQYLEQYYESNKNRYYLFLPESLTLPYLTLPFLSLPFLALPCLAFL